MVVRCTGKLLNLLGKQSAGLVEAQSSSEDWYANLLWLDRRKCLLATHAGTLSSLFVADIRAADLRPFERRIVDLLTGARPAASGTSTSMISTATCVAACTPRTANTGSRSNSCKNGSSSAGSDPPNDRSEPSFRHPQATSPFLRFRLGRWLGPRMTSRFLAVQAWALVSACWCVRAIAFFLLLGGLGVGFSVPLALLFLCAGAAAAALPIGPAGAATQIGAGAAALIASGVDTSLALAAALAVGALGVLSGAAVFLAAVVWRAGLSLAVHATSR